MFASIFEKLNWKRVAAITEDGQKYTEYITRMESNNKNYKMLINRKIPRDAKQQDIIKVNIKYGRSRGGQLNVKN